MGTSFADVERVLDFGCGCGRTLRWLMESYPATHFYGADVDADAVEWCARNLRNGVFVNSRPEPPLPFQSGYFDVVYCFSVFTHLDERMQDMWLIEIKRVLKPGGIVILTVHGERAAGTLDEEAAGILKSAGFMHQRSRKLSGLVPDWYNTSWHSQPYIVARLDALFSDVRYTVVPDGIQDLVVARNLQCVTG
jgi:SAM-dependent methyltransferase